MADICVDGTLTTGTEAGTVAGAAPTDGEWANAIHTEATIQTAIDGLVAGDTCHITRTLTQTAALDIDQADGALGNRIRLLGYNYNSGSPTVDGERAILDADGAAANCLNVASRDYWQFDNIRFTNATADNVTASGGVCNHNRWINCDFDNSLGDGTGNSGGLTFSSSIFVLCRFYSNVGGVRNHESSTFLLCSAYDNSASGFDMGSGSVAVDCIAFDNVFHNFFVGIKSAIVHCVSDNAGGAFGNIAVNNRNNIVFASRLTGTGIGLLGDNSAEVLDLFNFINTATKASDVTVDQQIRGADTRTETGTEGYIDAAAHNYGLTNDAAARRQAITL